ncbi:YggS family pyridoxal phosphate-dependent enzyme [uncultured Friedmanniella sp.]|uniref:YggS family pyridoxal phosphate-dependent enzyme n=1 Tax=uncultured Friedmanniella sp. TaxID=335381 RepID=UPI0035CBA573
MTRSELGEGRLAEVRARIAAACTAAGREVDEVRLMAVTKTHPTDVLAQAYAAGLRLFGENRVQEAAAKADELADRTDLRWAVIGPLQTNKVNAALGFAAEFHALDSLRLAQKLDRRLQELGRSLDVFVQVNSSGEETKSGLAPEEVEAFALALRPYASLRVRGLMTLAVFSDDQAQVAACFTRMQELQRRLRQTDAAPGSYDELSMGMSGDFELAIAHGATTVRVGQALFGARPAVHT